MVDRFANTMDVAALSDVGRRRQLNEDSYRVDAELGVLLVADGMGGHDAGEVASRMAVETVADFLYEYDPEDLPPDDETERDLPGASVPADVAALMAQHPVEVAAFRAAVKTANRRIHSENQMKGYREGSGMGTTVVGWLMLEDARRFAVCHVGDSRLYRWRDGVLTQLTRDHTLYQDWLDRGGQGDPPRKNIILRALGPWPEVDVDVAVYEQQSGDLYLLCSDGLSSLVEDDEIAGLVAAIGPDLAAGCQSLIAAANAAGGNDNITVILARAR